MKRLLLLITLSTSAVTGWALQPLQTQKQKAEFADIKSLMESEKKNYEKKIGDKLFLIDQASRKIDNSARVEELNDQLADIKYQHALVMSGIIERTIALYDLHPRETDGWIVTGPLAKERPTWKPRFAAMRDYKDVKRKDGSSVRLAGPGNYAGITWADGTIELNDAAFIYTPAYLAAIILHENVHFEQLTTVGRGDRISAARAEMEAHSQSSNRAVDRMLGLNDDEKRAVQSAFTEQLEKFRNSDMPGMMSMQYASDGPSPDGLEREKQSADDSFQSSPQDADDIASDAERQKRESDEAVTQIMRTEQLANLSLQTCQSPDRYSDDDLASYSWFPDPAHPIGDSSISALSACAGILFGRLRAANLHGQERLTAEFLHEQALAALRDAARSVAAVPAHMWGENAQLLKSLAERTCSEPQTLRDDFFTSLDWSPNSDSPMAAQISPTLSGCPRIVFDRLVQVRAGGRSLNAALARSFAPVYRPPVYQPRRQNDREPPERHSPDDWNSLRQLRGIGR